MGEFFGKNISTTTLWIDLSLPPPSNAVKSNCAYQDFSNQNILGKVREGQNLGKLGYGQSKIWGGNIGRLWGRVWTNYGKGENGSEEPGSGLLDHWSK